MNTQYLTTQPDTLIEQLACFIRGLNYRDKAQLVQLVPEFQYAPKSMSISMNQSNLMNFFDSFADEGTEPLPDDAIFIQGLTFAKFFALPDNEQSTIWNSAHTEAENRLGDRQKDIAPDALPA